MLKKTALALAGATALAIGAATPLTTAQAGSTAYGPSYYSHNKGHHNRHHYNHRGPRCHWVKVPVRTKVWSPWRGWVWTTSYRNKQVCR
ncbi:MAG: hypothetical protein AB7O70_14080 [Hyphomicrobiales bacterium]